MPKYPGSILLGDVSRPLMRPSHPCVLWERVLPTGQAAGMAAALFASGLNQIDVQARKIQQILK